MEEAGGSTLNPPPISVFPTLPKTEAENNSFKYNDLYNHGIFDEAPCNKSVKTLDAVHKSSPEGQILCLTDYISTGSPETKGPALRPARARLPEHRISAHPHAGCGCTREPY